MVRTLKRRFVFTAMSAITVFILLLLGGINLFNAIGNERQSDMLLESLVDARTRHDLPEGIEPLPEKHPNEEAPTLWNPRPNEDNKRSAVYFVAVFDENDEVKMVDTTRTASVNDEEAVQMAAKILSKKTATGRSGGWKYAATEAPSGEKTVVFLSTADSRFGALRVLLISILLGTLGWLLMLIFVVLLSSRTIRPIAENIEKQKRFVTDAGHELKTPLAIILANTDAMELHMGESKWSRNIKEQTVRLSGLMQNLLTLSKTDEGGKGIEKKTLDLSSLLEETVRMFEEGMTLKRLVCRQEITPTVCVDANERLLAQLFSILLDNAVKYTPEGGKICVSLKKEEKGVLFFIENETEALPGAAPEKLFDRFYRDDEARSRETGGYGIGLSAARSIAQAHGFRLFAEYIGDHTVRFLLKM